MKKNREYLPPDPWPYDSSSLLHSFNMLSVQLHRGVDRVQMMCSDEDLYIFKVSMLAQKLNSVIHI